MAFQFKQPYIKPLCFCMCDIWASSQQTAGLNVSCGLTAEANTDMTTVASGLGPNLTMASIWALVQCRLLHHYEKLSF